MDAGIKTNQVHGPANSRTGPTQSFADNRIEFGNRQFHLLHDRYRIGDIKNPDPVSDKIGHIFTDNHPFTEHLFTKVCHKIDNFRFSFGPGNNLQQFHIARRVEKMSP